MMTDADDSIVLDDLVRTAEASRLRRRGAIRLDSRLPQILSWDDDIDDDDDDDDEDEDEGCEPGHRLEYSYSLFCAAASTSPPFMPSILPCGSSTPKSISSVCATLLHVSAAPRRHLSFSWHALSTGASPSIVPLDPAYIDDPTPLGIHTAACGCAREALACAVCGNLLGTRFSSCTLSSHAHSRSNSYEYNFLGTAVTSAPVYTPGPSTTTPPSTTPQLQNQNYPPLLDRLITASPMPLTDEERAAYNRAWPTPAAQPRYSYGYGRGNGSAYLGYTGSGLGYGYGYERADDGIEEYNADGEIIRRESGGEEEDEASIDKAGEGMFVPER